MPITMLGSKAARGTRSAVGTTVLNTGRSMRRARDLLLAVSVVGLLSVSVVLLLYHQLA